jgi:serine/threonine-protein kinase RsbW|tara:strand:- start:10 stop:414 length:405 start_codon:yes stop_codon:yes gene_type:complete
VEHREISFESVAENIHIVENLIDEICETLDVNEEYYGNILISMTEAVNNAMVHGNKLDSQKKVLVTVKTDDTSIHFTISDEGPGFDYDNLPDPTAPENIEKPNGRGVFLMKNLADGCNFEENGRVVELEFKALN